jgi:hypothetical protein
VTGDETGPDEVVLLRHLGTGTPCPGLLCEECAAQDLLTGNVYLVAER